MQKVDGLKGKENVIAIALGIVFLIPFFLYYFDRTRLPYCTNCKRRVANPM